VLRRDPHPGDRRTRLVVLTRKGFRVYTQTAAIAREVDAERLSTVTVTERTTVEELLSKVSAPIEFETF
jgi:MarR family transcriptional regulator, lower aerobic nicotinate degradation pathway regulator